MTKLSRQEKIRELLELVIKVKETIFNKGKKLFAVDYVCISFLFESIHILENELCVTVDWSE